MRAYSRRHRRLRNRNAAPLMIVADGNLIGDAVAAIGRALFRYRSELAPLTTSAAMFLAAAFMHIKHAGWTAYILGLTGVLVAVIATTGFPFRLDRTSERLYAAVTTGFAGLWLAVATRVGPWRDPLPTILGVCALAAALPWWTHRRRRMRVTVDRSIQAWPNIAEMIGIAGSHIMSAVVDIWGWRARLSLRPGQTVADVIAHVPAIESGLGTRAGAVRVEPDPAHAGRCVLRVLAEDPHATAIPWSGPSIRSVADRLTLGVFEDGTPVQVSILRRNGLVGGVVGSGKSGVLNVILANLAACPDVVLWGIDLKGGMELWPWASCLDRLATTPAEAAAMLRDAVRVVEARAHAMGKGSARVWEPSPEHPALVIVVDEYAELVENAPGAAEAADSLARRGRAVAATMLAATQRPTQQAMGNGAVRSQMDVRICLRVRERRDADLILGQGMLAAGWLAHTLDAPGKFLISAEGHDHPKRARAFLVTDDDVEREASRCAPLRPSLDEPSASALGAPLDDANEVVDAELVDDPTGPETALWTALAEAPDEGHSVPELMMITGMGRTWIYDRLQVHALADRAEQVARGRWRATGPNRQHPAA
ncbi:S-DNA-T family DNA segregation ATPase FtsK/SpoIIIE [Catenulispora sp. GAS73]|uniref:FtsK/SpoIIIE domain-containing protein n=1 Tax=Catenulispora sp. GAS73 TaxID=3156269 RepID=UPI003519BE5B